MEIRVSGHQIETGEALQVHVSDRMNAIADKYFSRAIGAHATVGPASLVMRGESVPVGSRWSGNPIGPWRAVKVRAYQSTS